MKPEKAVSPRNTRKARNKSKDCNGSIACQFRDLVWTGIPLRALTNFRLAMKCPLVPFRAFRVFRGPTKVFKIKHWLTVALLLAATQASGAEFTVLHAQQSSVTFVSKQMGVPVEGSFRKFTARISVDPARPETGTAQIDIDLASVDTGMTEADEEVVGKNWFDVQNHPVASFISASVKQSGPGRYEAIGRLTIKGKTLNINAPFTLQQNAGRLVIDGMFPIRRLDYGIGTGIWGDTDTVADEVQIRFHLTLTQ